MCIENLPLENWRTVLFASDYMVSTFGRFKVMARNHTNINGIVSQRGEKLLEQSSPDGRYLQVAINRKLYRSHRLVLMSFVGEPPSPHHQCNHKNGNGFDNRLCNLEWVTPSENIQHSIEVLNNVKSSNKFSQEHINMCFNIYSDFSYGMSIAQLSNKYSLHETTVSKKISFIKDLLNSGNLPIGLTHIHSIPSREEIRLQDALKLYDEFHSSNLSQRKFVDQTNISRGALKYAISLVKKSGLR